MERIAGYDLLSKIATGGMAEIWVARARPGHVPTADARGLREAQGLCVIKRLLPQHANNEDYKRMFLEEGRIGASLVHPNIVRMFDFGSDGGTYYLAMEYLHGEDLRVVNRINRAEGRTMPLAHAVDIIIRACAGLHYAHELRGPDGAPLELVHRDVSPHNVFLTFDGQVKVVDFGIAKSLDRRWETKHGTLKGKVPYMSPEQIKARRLDRRTDIYATGVMLYELVLGRRPYVLSAGGDFAMMMAIARHDLRRPREVSPDIDPVLEEIILRAITYDPRGRFQTMEEMAEALQRFAASRRLETGPGPLAAYMKSLFGARVDAWKAAQAQDLAAHVVQVEEERAQSALYEEEEPDSTTFVAEAADHSTASHTRPSGAPVPGAPPSAASLVASTSSGVAAVLEVFGITVVTLRGRIDEHFSGAALGGSLSGTVLFDLKHVERVTSFGVREWLEMLQAIEEQDDVDVWLARCSEAVVTQMSLIRTFAGKAKLLSFQAPFLCDDCGNSFSRTLDCEEDAAWFRDGRGELPRCPRCGGAAKLDDDPAFFAFAAPYAGLRVPERIRNVLATVQQSDGRDVDVVDKTVSNDETRVRVNRDVDRSVRWNRIFDGIEGKLVIDFRGAPRVSSEGATNFAHAIKALGAEVTNIEILECPVNVLTALGERATGGNERLRIVSVAFAGRCHSCGAARTGVVPMSEVVRVSDSGEPPFVPCRRCNAALDVSDTAPSLKILFNPPSSARAVAAAAPPSTPSPVSDLGEREPSAPAPPPSAAPREGAKDEPSRMLVVALVAAAAVLAVVLVIAGVLRARPSTGSMTSAVAAATTEAGASGVGAPSDAETSSVEIGPEAVEITITLPGSGSESDVALARSRAVLAAVERLERSVSPEVGAANLAAPPEADLSSIERRFNRDVGAFASPERTEVRVEGSGASAKVRVRYRIARWGWDQAVSFYDSRRVIFGLTLARALPNRRDGLVVVEVDASRHPDVVRGAVLLSLDERSTSTGFDALPRKPKASHNAVFAVGTASLSSRLK